MNPKKLFTFNENSVKGIFHKYKTKSGASKRLDLCANEEARFKDYPLNRKKRCRCNFYHDDISECPKVIAFLLPLHTEFEDRLRKKALDVEYSKIKKTDMLKKSIDQYLNETLVLAPQSTYRAYKNSLRIFSEWMPNQPMSAIEWLDKDDFILFLKNKRHRHSKGSGFRNSSIVSHLANISGFFSWAYNKRMMDQNLNWQGRKFLFTKPEQEIYTDELLDQLEDLLRFRMVKPLDPKDNTYGLTMRASKHVLRAIIMARNTAMRISEIWSLPLCNITKHEIQIRDQPELGFTIKDHENRDVEINDDLNRFLFDEDQRTETEIWYHDNGFGLNRYSTSQSLSHALGKILRKDFNVQDLRPFHAIRAYAIEKMLTSGRSATSVRDVCGHSRITTTEGYLPSRLKHHQSAVSALNKNVSSMQVQREKLI